MTMTICCDVDGVLANFSKAYAKLLVKLDGDRLPKGWETDPEFPSTWYWERAAGYPHEVEKEVWEKHILAKRDFWSTLDPLPTAREALSVLNGMQKRGDQVWFLTHRMGNCAHIQTCEYLYEHGIDYPQVIMAADKVPWLRALGANFFVDDKPETAEDVVRVSSEEHWPNFKFYMKLAPYNKDLWGKVPGVVSIKDAMIAAGIWE